MTTESPRIPREPNKAIFETLSLATSWLPLETVNIYLPPKTELSSFTSCEWICPSYCLNYRDLTSLYLWLNYTGSLNLVRGFLYSWSIPCLSPVMFNSKSEKFFLAELSQFYKKPASVTGDLSLTKVGFDIFDLLNINN